MIQKSLVSVALFLLTGGAGFWLGKLGKPYSVLVFTIHKMVALAFVIFVGLTLFDLFKTTNPKVLLIVASIVLGMAVIALFATGAFMSMGKLPFGSINLVHKVAATLVLICVAVITYLKINN